VGEVSLKNGVVPEMINIPRLATGGTVNIHVEPPSFVLECVKGFPNLLFRHPPAGIRQTCNDGGFEVLVPLHGLLVAPKRGVGGEDG
jgi:hypothetical protein